MTRANYAIPINPVYNPEIPSLIDKDPASATLTFNPLFLRLIENAHALKLTADTLNFQVSMLTGYDIARTVNTHADLPSAAGLQVGTLVAVRSDETRGGISAIFELNAAGQWVFAGEMVCNLQSQIQSMKNDIKLLMYLVQQMKPVGSFLGAGAYLGADDSILIK